MPQRVTPVQAVQVDYDCDECGEPMARAGSYVMTCSPPLYPHACPNGHQKNLDQAYPHSGSVPLQP